jgi:hypothetical protein
MCTVRMTVPAPRQKSTKVHLYALVQGRSRGRDDMTCHLT